MCYPQIRVEINLLVRDSLFSFSPPFPSVILNPGNRLCCTHIERVCVCIYMCVCICVWGFVCVCVCVFRVCVNGDVCWALSPVSGWWSLQGRGAPDWPRK